MGEYSDICKLINIVRKLGFVSEHLVRTVLGVDSSKAKSYIDMLVVMGVIEEAKIGTRCPCASCPLQKICGLAGTKYADDRTSFKVYKVNKNRLNILGCK
ncbi:MAG: hypothetical protein ABWW69_06855 [Pyrodictiaceae archaeon]